MNKLFNEIDKSLDEYDKSMKEIFRLLDENVKILSDLQEDVDKIRSCFLSEFFYFMYCHAESSIINS